MFGDEVAVDDLADVLGTSVGTLLSSLGEVTATGVMVSTSDGVVFRDERERQGIYEDIPEPVRRGLHRQIGRLLLERGGAAAAAAGHLTLATRSGDRSALHDLDRVIDELRPRAPDTAAVVATQALDLTEPADPSRYDRTVRAVEAHLAARRLDEGVDLARRALAGGQVPADPAARLRLAVASVQLVRGEAASARAEAEAVLAGRGGSDLTRGDAEVARLVALLSGADFRLARAPADAILAGEAGGGGEALAGALYVMGFIAWADARVADALGFVRAAMARIDPARRAAFPIYPRLVLAPMLTAVGEFEAAHVCLEGARARIDDHGAGMWADGPLVARARNHFAAGRLDAAVADAEAGLAVAAALGTQFFAPRAQATLAEVALLRGDVAEAERRMAEAQCLPTSPTASFGADTMTWVGARVVEAAAGPEAAVDSLARVYDNLSEHRRLFLETPAAAAWMARTATAVGRHQQAETVVRFVDQLAVDNREFEGIVASAVHARGVLEHDVHALEQAALAHRHPWARASAWEDAGRELDLGGGSSTDAFERALSIYEEIGAECDASRVRACLRELGVRHRHGRQADRPVSGWSSLTDTELVVAGHVAEGLTNVVVARRMYLSRHTVDFHLRQIFRKLDIHSRVELTRLTLARAVP
ncbi:MAG: hypothetical protein QOG87_2193 [Actinomycetota bacterium]